MLVLSRKKGEGIAIGEPGPEQITVTVVEVRPSAVRLGIEAKREIPIVRLELVKRDKEKENTE